MFSKKKHFPNLTFEEICLTSEEELRQVFAGLEKDQGLLIEVMCEYPKHQGRHTHYLAAQQWGERVLVVGDLSPFGLNSVGISLTYGTLIHGMRQVIGAELTTDVAETLLRLNQLFGDSRETKIQQYNASIQNFNF